MGHGAIVAQDYEGLVDFYKDVAGLEVAQAGVDGSYTVFTGPLDRHDLVILPLTEGREPGMHHVGFELKSEEEVEAAEAEVKARGIEPEASIDSSTKRSFFLLDPDGLRLEFYVSREGDWEEVSGVDVAYQL